MEPYPITSPSTDITIARQGDGTLRGSGSFTVTNKTGVAVRARVDAASQDPAAPMSTPAPATWFSLDQGTGSVSGPARSSLDCDFALDETRQFSVEVNVPPGAPAGVYSARPFAASSDKSDEVFTYGDAWRVTVPAVDVPAKRKVPAWIFLVAAAMLLLIGVTIWRLSSGKSTTATTSPTTTASTVASNVQVNPSTTALGRLARPMPTAPLPAAVFHLTGFPESPDFMWNQVPGASSYLLEIMCTSASCSNTSLKTMTVINPPVTVAGFSVGFYKWQVTANGLNRPSSIPSVPRTFEVRVL